MKNKHTVCTNNSDLFDAENEIKDFLKTHKKDLSDEEHGKLGELLERRASAISDLLGVKVSSITSSRKK